MMVKMSLYLKREGVGHSSLFVLFNSNSKEINPRHRTIVGVFWGHCSALCLTSSPSPIVIPTEALELTT